MRLLVLLLLLTAPAPTPAGAQDIPACTQDRVGAVACMAGKLCACGYQRGGVVSGRPDGYLWDCGVLRPPCGEALPPAALPGFPQPLPELLLTVPPHLVPQMQQPMGPQMTPWRR